MADTESAQGWIRAERRRVLPPANPQVLRDLAPHASGAEGHRCLVLHGESCNCAEHWREAEGVRIPMEWWRCRRSLPAVNGRVPDKKTEKNAESDGTTTVRPALQPVPKLAFQACELTAQA